MWKGLDYEKQEKILSRKDSEQIYLLYRVMYGEHVKKAQLPPIDYNWMLKSSMYSDGMNRVSRMQVQIWNEILTKEDKYKLWFEQFNALDRVRLWNQLVFSESYLQYLAQQSQYRRNDLKYILGKVNAKIQAEVDRQKRISG